MMVEVTVLNIILFGLSWQLGLWIGDKLYHLVKPYVLRCLRKK